MERYLIIGLGGFIGANTRYLVSGWAADRWGAAFPYGTLLINVTGSFALGLFLAATADRLMIDPRWRLFLAIGFLGAYTTFSTYTYESVQLALEGGGWPAIANVVGSNALGVLAVLAGIVLGQRL
jgi:CrcB protein